jgi:hypothetical protein
MSKIERLLIGSAAATIALSVASSPSFAVEGGASMYLLGSKLPLSGVVPGPGMYFQNDTYFYQGDIGGNIRLPIGGQIIANVDAFLVFNAPTFIGVTPYEILGGRLGFGAIVPFGYSDINATIGPFSIEDEVFTVGDPLATAFLGWDAGNVHWSFGTLVNFPIGDYQEGQIAQIALHRWGVDFTGAMTWLDPQLGLELSVAAGFTINGENDFTDYDSGNEFHFEGAAMKYLNQHVNFGIAGYYYHQITGDSGSGARLGPFEGEVAAIGGIAGFNFELGHLPVQTRVKYFHEFDAVNRLEGDAVYLTASMPLWVPPPPAVVTK